MFKRVLVLIGCLTVSAAAADVAALDVEMSSPLVLADGARTAYLRVELRGLNRRSSERAPVNVAIVLDRSGSMQGEKIAEARRAAIAALQHLDRDDIVSVVTYQSTVDVVVPATKLHDRRAVEEAIRRIGADGKTALFGGVSKGARELEKFLDENRVNTLLLLSDGLANIGPSSPGELRQLGASLARQGISVTTIGLGLDYNEDLMTGLAMASDGNHFFVEEARDLETAFSKEFGGAVSVVAQGVRLHIRCAEGVRPVRVLGRKAQISGQSVHASMNQLLKDQARYLMLELEIDAGADGRVQRVADVEARFRNLLDGGDQTLMDSAVVTATSSAAAVENRRNREVNVEVVRQIGAEQNLAATALRDEGRVEEARRAFESNAQYLQRNYVVLQDEELRKEAESNVRASENVEDDAEWKRERKVQKQGQYATQQSIALPSAKTKADPKK